MLLVIYMKKNMIKTGLRTSKSDREQKKKSPKSADFSSCPLEAARTKWPRSFKWVSLLTRWNSVLVNNVLLSMKASAWSGSSMSKWCHGQLSGAHGRRMLPLQLSKLLVIRFVDRIHWSGGGGGGGGRYCCGGQVWIGAEITAAFLTCIWVSNA